MTLRKPGDYRRAEGARAGRVACRSAGVSPGATPALPARTAAAGYGSATICVRLVPSAYPDRFRQTLRAAAPTAAPARTVTEARTQNIFRQTTSGALASLHVGCPTCGSSYLVPVPTAGAGAGRRDFPCGACGATVPLDGSGLDPAQPVARCAVCGNDEFYIQKDFNRVLGLWVVVASGLSALLVMLLVSHLAGLVVLFAVTVLDWIVFRRLRDVTVCYLCNTIYRGFPRGGNAGPFYLGNEERFKALRQTWMAGLRE